MNAASCKVICQVLGWCGVQLEEVGTRKILILRERFFEVCIFTLLKYFYSIPIDGSSMYLGGAHIALL
ncbi:hypothetical protein JTE90_014433 [Oedothorax gibbosus]|uniref:Uncharacterized protein n=1 Tax=Oedothorax gibbosus TaxID=931172 RepID=A0AAV6V1Y4_9ARAC|nr:hypothetical protein JTE90_014433 [Oedothorax gibbosus]